eukprot:TRINITY_DN13427_c0_g1_i3.p1 TRINITY_DN13427_c0_g1~~TRINITY_DN13427_c0_g1_i3.p1  ORF type:complete len:120 (-),score=21.65 TRINITY_DN13427_c0_g1_i3:152-511(-)
MANRGVWQLRKMVINFCDQSGSSMGVREFIARVLPEFQAKNPQLEVVTNVLRGEHPHADGSYKNWKERTVDLKNQSSSGILQQITNLRNSTGRKVVKLKSRQFTDRPSIQGTWTPDLKL